jgi:hypothetical protein
MAPLVDPVTAPGCAISSLRMLALRRRGLFRDPVVPAFLECLLELGVGGANRLVSFPCACTAVASALVNASRDSSDERFRVSGSSPASGSVYRLVFGTGISFASLSARTWMLTVALSPVLLADGAGIWRQSGHSRLISRVRLCGG